jgi:hypothetical protein
MSRQLPFLLKSADFLLVVDVRLLLRRLTSPDLGRVLGMLYVLGIGRLV